MQEVRAENTASFRKVRMRVSANVPLPGGERLGGIVPVAIDGVTPHLAQLSCSAKGFLLVDFPHSD